MEASVVRGYLPPGLPVEILAGVRGMQPLTQRVQHVVPTTRLASGIADQPGSQAESAILFAHQPRRLRFARRIILRHNVSWAGPPVTRFPVISSSPRHFSG